MVDGKPNDIVIKIKEMIDMAKAPVTNGCCIYKVPREIRKLNNDAYTPKVISIGPFHHKDSFLQKMESQKHIYLKSFLQRTRTELVHLFTCIEELEPRVRCCYSEKIDFPKEEFVQMILLDAGFILELFCQLFYDEELLMVEHWLMDDIMMDLYLLENQLPFFVLDKLYNVAFVNCPRVYFPTFLRLTLDAFKDDNKQKLVPRSDEICHFTDLLRTFHLQPSNSRPRRKGKHPMHIYTITELHEAGVEFKVKERSQCLLDLKFSGSVLEISHLQVEDSTETRFRNIMALEQCHYPNKQYIIDYIIVLDHLVNKESDVEVLIRKGIFQNMLGNNKVVAELINGLVKNIALSDFNQDYHVICKDLNAFYEDPCHTRMATLRRDYCNTPWKTVASFAAMLILVLTLIQTVCSIIQVVK